MRFVAESGLWTTDVPLAAVPLTAVLEVSGAVLSWTVDEPDATVHIAFTDPVRAEWLWRIVGDDGHSAIVSALAAAPEGELDVEGISFDADALRQLRRLALGHWLRRWWPASDRDGIVELDDALLAGELALLTASAEDYFTDATFDSDVAELLTPHAEVWSALARSGDPRVGELVLACTELAEDTGISVETPVVAAQAGTRDDYALVAGAGAAGGAAEAVARGVASVNWAAVPPRVFDAAEDTVDWHVETDGAVATAVVRAQLSGPGSPAGIAVHVRSGGITGAGQLDGTGTATVALLDEGHRAVTETIAWSRDWQGTAVTIGVDVGESSEMRDRVRAFARARLQRLGADAFLAEVLAAESDY
ncbi:hypothetical protein [Mycolicibacterium iranicum]|uniref:Uncharacterized protein n=1 Tax=Mycolicibacterium iranicum TaxID=912594 RepID=A0A178LV48_MYCIR|nr:hypothetical protein [Mycolicibacterium iranicum]OAN37389.1 hypothetical protein A4X20_22910 [Mycolicibacterium iranicum]